mgnify:CR=1 FL=1
MAHHLKAREEKRVLFKYVHAVFESRIHFRFNPAYFTKGAHWFWLQLLCDCWVHSQNVADVGQICAFVHWLLHFHGLWWVLQLIYYHSHQHARRQVIHVIIIKLYELIQSLGFNHWYNICNSNNVLLTGDTCDCGWEMYEGNCYSSFTSYDNHSAAQEYCRSMGANLASIHSLGENDFVASLM